MIAQTFPRFSARWAKSLAAVPRGASAADAWIHSWRVFFNELQLHGGGADNTDIARFDSVPAPLLKSIAQHWVDQVLLTVTCARLDEVYKPVQVHSSEEICGIPHQPLSSPSSPVTKSFDMETLLATWSAHMLLSVAQTPHETSVAVSSNHLAGCKGTAPATVSEVLAACLVQNVIPPLDYLTLFAGPSAPTTVSYQHHHLASSRRIVRHALVLLLSSFVVTWREAPQDKTVPYPGSAVLTEQEISLALELRRCIDALSGSDQTPKGPLTKKIGSDVVDSFQTRHISVDELSFSATSLDTVTETQLALAQADLVDLLSPDSCVGGSRSSCTVNIFSHERDSKLGDGPLCRACEAWVARPLVSSSPFAGISKVHKNEEASGDILEHVNSQLNEISRRTLRGPGIP